MENLIISNSKQNILLPCQKILYMSADGRYTTIYTSNGNYTICKNIGLIGKDIPSPPFIRIHNKYIVNLKHVEQYNCQVLTLKDNITLPISRRRYGEIKDMCKNYFKLNLN
jgi:two-component system, LytTR family, response regulator